MKSLTTPDFWQAYAKLPDNIQRKADKAYQIWQENIYHPSLHFKKVGRNLWSARITRNYRALAIKKEDNFYWIWIGSHDEYELLLR